MSWRDGIGVGEEGAPDASPQNSEPRFENSDHIFDVRGFNKYDPLADPTLSRPLPLKIEDIHTATPLSGERGTALDRAWRDEVDLITRTGRGTRWYTSDEISMILNGAHYTDLNLTGHHSNAVAARPEFQGDGRNIFFLRQGAGGEHMRLGHPGGTSAPQPEKFLIDRRWMLDNLDSDLYNIDN